MSNLKYSANELLQNDSIVDLYPDAINTSAGFIALETKISVTFECQLSYLIPNSADRTPFLVYPETLKVLNFDFDYDNLNLTTAFDLEQWHPKIVAVGQVIYFLELPRICALEVKAKVNNLVVYHYFSRSDSLNSGLSLKIPSFDLNSALLNFDLATDEATKFNWVFTWLQSTDKIIELTEDPLDLSLYTAGTLICLEVMYAFTAKLEAVRVVDDTLISRVKDRLQINLDLLLAATDLKSGMTFALRYDLTTYSQPSYFLTVLFIILAVEYQWIFDDDTYQRYYLSCLSIYRQRLYNPSIENLTIFRLSQRFIDTYLAKWSPIDTEVLPDLEDISYDVSNFKEQLLASYCSNCRPQDPNLLLYAQRELPNLATLNPLNLIVEFKALSLFYLNLLKNYLPVGYRWPTQQLLDDPGSVWRALHVAWSDALSSSYLRVRDKLNRYSYRPNLNSIGSNWVKQLVGIPSLDPFSNQLVSESVLVSLLAPKYGLSSIAELAYAAGFVPVSLNLTDYAYCALQYPAVRVDLPERTTLIATDVGEEDAYVNQRVPGTFSAIGINQIASRQLVGLNSSDSYATEDRLADRDDRPVDFSKVVMTLTLNGVGKPHKVNSFIRWKLPVGVVAKINFYTYGKADSATTEFKDLEITTQIF